jgi:hypothetical protein
MTKFFHLIVLLWISLYIFHRSLFGYAYDWLM